jgi:hypothetical protein
MLVIADSMFVVVLPHNATYQDHVCAAYTFWKVAGITVGVRVSICRIAARVRDHNYITIFYFSWCNFI